MSEVSSTPARKWYLGSSFIIAALSVAAVLIFIAQNDQKTQVKFLFIDATVPLWILMVIIYVLGWLLGGSIWRMVKPGKGAKE